MEVANFLSSLGGGGAVLTLSWWVFSRLIERVDKLADKVNEIDKVVESRKRKYDEIDDHADAISDHKARIGILEAQIKTRYNGLL